MATRAPVKVPDIGDFQDVEVIEVLVSPGDEVALDQPLVTIESDKASIDIPSERAGVVAEVMVKVGDKVSEGSAILVLEAADAEVSAQAPPVERAPQSNAAQPVADSALRAQVVVLGAGPGGYTAAFRAADLGKDTILIERYQALGGVCLNVGCIPSKALLHTAEIIDAAQASAAHGLTFAKPKLDLKRLAAWKDSVVGQLTKGLAGLAKQRKVRVVTGAARFTSAHELEVQTASGALTIAFEQAIIAAGSQPSEIASFPNDDPRVMDSTAALLLDNVPKRMLVIGGGIIGLEMATVYHALGSKVTVVELMDGLMPGCDRDLVRPLQKRIEKQYERIMLGTKVTAMEAQKKGLKVSFEGPGAAAPETYDRVLVAVGRRPNGDKIGAENAGVHVDANGFIPADEQQRTNVAHIYAIGDIAGGPMLAHKATHEGKVAAEVAAGMKSRFEALTIPSVAYTNPEVAWTGVTEEQAKAQDIAYDAATFPWLASGRSLGMGRKEGLTKLLFDKGSKRLIGAGIVGPHAGDLIAEATLALELGAEPDDIGLTIHPHPTLSETLAFAAEMVEGTITDLYVPRKK